MKKNFIRLKWSLLLLLFFQLLSISLMAQQQKELKFFIRPLVKPRSDAPIPAEIQFDWSSAAVITGNLKLEIYSGDKLLLDYTTELISLTTGVQKRNILIPACKVYYAWDKTTAKGTFVTEEGVTYKLEPSPFSLPDQKMRNQVICLSAFRHTHSKSEGAVLARSLKLENFDRHKHKPERRTMGTSVLPLEADEMPSAALNYSSFNIVMLYDEGFSDLKKKQLDALKEWTLAGGALCVIPGKQTLESYHADFLNSLLNSGKFAVPLVSLDKEGRLKKIDSGGPLILSRTGCGRFVLVSGEFSSKNIDSPAWNKVAGFLWQLRGKRLASLTRSGKWYTEEEYQRIIKPPTTEKNSSSGSMFGNKYYYNYNTYDYSSYFEYEGYKLGIGDKLVSSLLPKTSRLIPFRLVVIILVFFILAVGPLDYYILGKFRKRPLTWITFPLISIAVTLLIMFLSEEYMGRNDHTGTVSFIDIDKGGAVLKTNTLEVLFTAREKTQKNINRDIISTPLNYKTFTKYSGDLSGKQNLRFVGRFAGNYDTYQHLRQWTPQLNRRMYFGSSEEKSPWMDNLDKINPFTGKLNDLESIIFGEDKENISVVALFGGDENALAGQHYYTQGFPYEIIGNLSVRFSDKGFFSVVTGVPPAGGDSFEDMPLLDVDNPNECLVLIVIKEGSDFKVYRRLYVRK